MNFQKYFAISLKLAVVLLILSPIFVGMEASSVMEILSLVTMVLFLLCLLTGTIAGVLMIARSIQQRKAALINQFGTSRCPAIAGLKQIEAINHQARRESMRRQMGMEPISAPPPLPEVSNSKKQEELSLSLKSLQSLRDQGLITKEEFLSKRCDILNRI